MVATVLDQMMTVDPPVFADELRSVRERQRSPKLVDELLQRTAGLGQLV